MIDFNHILLFIAIASPLILLGRIARLRNRRNHGWRMAALIVLTVSVLAGILFPSMAGFIGGIFWTLLLVVPSAAERKIDQSLLAQRFAEARHLAVVRQIFHPWGDFPYRPSLLRDLELATGGQLDLALDRLARERGEASSAGRFGTALTFALTENWAGLLQWCRRDIGVTTDPAVFSLYLRALGETGARNDLILQLASNFGNRKERGPTESRSSNNLAIALAFSGRPDDFVRLTEDGGWQMPEGNLQFWRGTAELAAGRTRSALERLEKLRRETQDALLRRSIERRLTPAEPAPPLSPRSEMLLDRLLETTGPRGPTFSASTGVAWSVWVLILINIAVFALELTLGGSTNSTTLESLGALQPAVVVVRHEYWRLLSALFLHYGPLHLTINLFALYILGPPLERLIGAAKFTAGYLLSGLGSSAGVVLLSVLGLTNATQLVGASGAIMGVIGISAGLLLRHRRTPLAGRQLQNILAILAIQTAFDLWTPQVSLAAHLCGFLSGVAVGAVFASRTRATS